MATVNGGTQNNPLVLADELDDLFDYSVPADIFQDVDTNMEVSERPAKVPIGDAGKENGGGLGIDEEIRVSKKRAPVAKLDEDRLLSSAGIPRLRKITKERLKFKGKGHEYSDVSRLLNVYQLWLDDLYPRAKFADGLAIIEKLGHRKSLQIMRKAWINEGKPREKNDDVDFASDSRAHPQVSSSADKHPGDAEERTRKLAVDSWSVDDFLGLQVSSKEAQKRRPENASKESLFISDEEAGGDAPPKDDLDALLAEDEVNAQTTSSASRKQIDKNGRDDINFDDEMEAMAGLDDMW